LLRESATSVDPNAQFKYKQQKSLNPVVEPLLEFREEERYKFTFST